MADKRGGKFNSGKNVEFNGGRSREMFFPT